MRRVAVVVVLCLGGAGTLGACGPAEDPAQAAEVYGCAPERIVLELAALDTRPAAQADLVGHVIDGCADAGAVLAETYRLGRVAASEQACPVPPPPAGAPTPEALQSR